jgi:hypothetical protein
MSFFVLIIFFEGAPSIAQEGARDDFRDGCPGDSAAVTRDVAPLLRAMGNRLALWARPTGQARPAQSQFPGEHPPDRSPQGVTGMRQRGGDRHRAAASGALRYLQIQTHAVSQPSTLMLGGLAALLESVRRRTPAPAIAVDWEVSGCR